MAHKIGNVTMSIVRKLHERLSVGAKVGILLGAMLVVAGVNVGVVYYYQSQVETIGNSVNYAGQQRMLSQRMARYANKLDQSDSAVQTRDNLKAVIEQFDRNVKILLDGGTINGDKLHPAPQEVRDELQRERALWTKYREHVQTIVASDSGSQDVEASLEYIRSNSDKLLKVSDEVTAAFSTISTSKTGFMKRLLLILFAINVGVFGIGTYVGRRYIGTPIRQIAEVADALAQGRIDTDLTTEVSMDSEIHVAEGTLRDEMKQLARSFEALQNYLVTASNQAKALANKNFDAPVLDQDIPGEFGETLDRMQRDLRDLVGNLEGLNRQLEAKADAYRAVMEKAAEGDLTQRMNPESESEAMVEIGEAFNEMMDEFEGTVTRISEFAEDVATSSQEVSVNVEEIQSASEQVNVSIQEISTGAETQSRSLDEVSGEMLSLSETIEEVATSADRVASTAQHAAEVGRAGSESATDAIEDMETIESKAHETVSEVESLADEIDEISEIVGMVNDVTEQTNLLALNASIEAARAGKAGEGFAVVAEEIKELAEETAEATETIEALIGDVQSSATEAVEDMREMVERVSSGTETVGEALQALEEIAERVDDANDGVQEISEATDSQAASTEEVVRQIDEVAGVAEQTSTEATNVSSAAEEQTRSLTEMSDYIQSLAQRTDELREMLGGFSTSGQMANVAAGVDADAERSLQATTNGNGGPQRDHTAGSA